MGKGIFDRLEDIINQTKEENKNNPHEEDAPTSIFDMILEKSKEILSDEDDEDTAKHKIKRKVDEVVAERIGEAPTSIFDRVKDLMLEGVSEETQQRQASSNHSLNSSRKSKNTSTVIPNIDIPNFDELIEEHKVKLIQFRGDKEDDIQNLIEKYKREEERWLARNQRELERKIEWENRVEEEFNERLLRKQEKDVMHHNERKH